MRRGLPLVLLMGCAAGSVLGADNPVTTTRRVRLGRVDASSSLPAGFRQPEGTSRWSLGDRPSQETWIRTCTAGEAGITVRDEGLVGSPVHFSDPAGGDAARRWIFPDNYPDLLRPGARQTIEVLATRDGVSDRLRIEVQTVGIGWAELPGGPRETILQRALILKEGAGRRGFVPDALVHRWVDPRAGVVAEIEGPTSHDGRRRETIASATVVEEVLQGAADLVIRTSEMWSLPHTDLAYGRDRGPGTSVASLTSAPGITSMGDLIALNTWDFSVNTTGNEVGFTTTTVSSAETCNAARCGYTVAGALLERTDKNFPDPPNIDKINDVVSLESRANDDVIWVWAGAQHEGRTGGIGEGESRFCYQTFGGVARTPVPLWMFSHQDTPGGERYMQVGDSWQGGPFNCEQNIFNEVCGGGGLFSTLYSKACLGNNGVQHTGMQSTAVLKAGVVTVPSGHTFNALLTRVVADFCVYGTNTCGALFKFAEVLTVNYLWQVPHLGTVVRLQSAQNVIDFTSFMSVEETDIKFGLYPPRSISVTGATDTSVALTWDPGLDTHRINAYKIYWDTDPGAANSYAFNSQANPGQVSFAGATATVSGLQPRTAYYFTVTSLSNFTNPSTLVTRTYESLLYPTQVSGDPAFIYPVEVQALTSGGICIPTAEVQNLTVAHDPLGIRICWDPVSDPCLVGYEVLGAATLEAAANYSVVADTGIETCWAGNPAGSFFLVVARGTGGNGPWVHYGQ